MFARTPRDPQIDFFNFFTGFLGPGRCLDGFVPHFSSRYTPRDPKILILDLKSIKFHKKHRFSSGKTRFSIRRFSAGNSAATRRQPAGNRPGKDNSAPAEYLHNKNPSLVALGKNIQIRSPVQKTSPGSAQQEPFARRSRE